MTLDNKIQPTATGTQADLSAGVDISKVHGGYFSNLENAKKFCEIGLNPILSNLPREIHYADYGGGEGFLTKEVTRWLTDKGLEVVAFVADANEKYLNLAKIEGLETILCNLENCPLTDLDLITMRAVNHYNPISLQKLILKNVYNALNPDGVLLSQISSGVKENCALRSSIMDIPELGRGVGNYHWTSVQEYQSLLSEAGFIQNEVLGYAPPAHWCPEEQWDRFNQKEEQTIEAGGDLLAIEKLKQRKQAYLKKANSLVEEYIGQYGKELLTIEENNGKYIIHYLYPIIKSRKS